MTRSSVCPVDFEEIQKVIDTIDEYNFDSISELVCNFLNTSCNEEHKAVIYRQFVSKISVLFERKAFRVIEFFTVCKNDSSIDMKNPCVSASFLNFCRSVLNEKEIVEKIKRYLPRRRADLVDLHSAYKIINNMQKVFSKESVLEILEGTKFEDIFLIFGCHPVLLDHLKLQKKWIRYYSKNRLSYVINRWYVTDEALKSVPFNIRLRFARKFLQNAVIDEHNPPHFSPKIVKEPLLVAIIGNKDVKKVQKLLTDKVSKLAWANIESL